MSDLKQRALELHEKVRGKLSIEPKVPLTSKADMALAYSPGVAEPCRKIAEDSEMSYKYTGRGNTVAIISDGTAVLGLGDIGALAAMPVMEGKAALFKVFAGIDVVPLVLDTKDPDEIVQAITAIAPSFGGINLEDIKAPTCFEVEEKLIEALDIPVFHDDQHGTAIVALAGLINALKVVGKQMEDVRIVLNGAGAAGIAIAKLLLHYGFKDLTLLDSRGAIYEGRDNLNPYKEEMAKVTNRDKREGSLEEIIKGADVFLGISKANLVSQEMVRSMEERPIIFAMANPDPEILPEDALAAGAAVVATGRSDYPNQVNNVLAFPGIFRGVLDVRARRITIGMRVAAAEALAALVKEPRADYVIPDSFEPGVAEAVAEAVKSCYKGNE